MTGTAQQVIAYMQGYLAAPEHDKNQIFEFDKHRAKRTLTQNSYYWQLCTKVSQALHQSTARTHNELLRDCDLPIVIDGKVAYITLPDTDEAENTAIEADTFHIKPTSSTTIGENGTRFRVYKMLRGSHEMNTVEFSHLVDLLVQEAQQQGIETLPPHELEHLKQMAMEREKRSEKRSTR